MYCIFHQRAYNGLVGDCPDCVAAAARFTAIPAFRIKPDELNPADWKTPAAIILDHDPRYPSVAEAVPSYTLGYVKPKPRLRLRVMLGACTKLPYWAVTTRDARRTEVKRWHTTSDSAVRYAELRTGLGLPIDGERA